MASSPLDAYLGIIFNLLKENKTNEEIVAELAELGVETSESSVRRCIRRNESLQEAAEVRRVTNEVKEAAEPYQFKYVSEDEIEVTLPPETDDDPPTKKLTVEYVMARHKLDPEEWEAFDVLPNEWEGQRKGGTKITFNQFKFRLRRRVPLRILLPAIEPLSKKYKAAKVNTVEPVITVVETDAHCPFVNPELNALAINFIEWLQPDRHVVGGDLLNLGYISRHRDNPKWDDTVNDAIQTGFEYLYYRREVAPDMEMWLIPGNHDDRIRNEQLERNERLYGVKRAHYPDEEPGNRVYSLAHLLRLADLDIHFSEPEGTYEFEYVEITPLLAVRHGHKISKAGALKTANELGHSVVLGHTHRQSANAETIWNKLAGTWQTRWALEAGSLTLHDEGMGFLRGGAPDWQPGFVTVTSWPNGEFTFDFAQYTQRGELLWRDKRFTLN